MPIPQMTTFAGDADISGASSIARVPVPAAPAGGEIRRETPMVFRGGRMIYATGLLEEGAIEPYAESCWHLFRLPSNAGGRWLFFRIYAPDSPHIGLPLIADNKALVGEHEALTGYIIRNSVDRFALGCLFVLVGLLSIDLFFHRWKQRTYHYLSFGAFTACAGLASVHPL